MEITKAMMKCIVQLWKTEKVSPNDLMECGNDEFKYIQLFAKQRRSYRWNCQNVVQAR